MKYKTTINTIICSLTLGVSALLINCGAYPGLPDMQPFLAFTLTQNQPENNVPTPEETTTTTASPEFFGKFESYLKASNATTADLFGRSVAISGDLLVVGTPGERSTTNTIIYGNDLSATNDSGANNGAVYVFRRTGTSWVQEAYLKAPNNSLRDAFGSVVAVEGDTIAVGAPNEDSTTNSIIHGSDLSATNDSGDNNGAVYVYRYDGTNWALEAYLKAPNNSDGDNFGWSLNISNDTIAVSAYQEASSTNNIIHGSDLSSTNDLGNANGAVYVFRRNGSIWHHEAYLKAPKASDDDGFGSSVAISGDTIVAGSLYEGSTTSSIIHGNDLTDTNDLGTYTGAAYVFRRNGSTWAHEAYLKAPNTSNNDYFSISVDISGETIVVGASGENSTTNTIIHGSDLSATNDTGSGNGAAYVYTRSGTIWTHVAYLKAPNNSASSSSGSFGSSVAIEGNTIVVGAEIEDSTTNAILIGEVLYATNTAGNANGAAYVFKRSNSRWSHYAYLKAPNNSNQDRFGAVLDISEDTIIASAYFEDSDTTDIINGWDLSSTNGARPDSGAVYVFR